MFMIYLKKENTIPPSVLPIRKLVHQKYGFEYTVAVRGYHYFKTMQQPKENEVLVCQFLNGNSYDMFDIKTCDQRGTMVGHLSREVYH